MRKLSTGEKEANLASKRLVESSRAGEHEIVDKLTQLISTYVKEGGPFLLTQFLKELDAALNKQPAKTDTLGTFMLKEGSKQLNEVLAATKKALGTKASVSDALTLERLKSEIIFSMAHWVINHPTENNENNQTIINAVRKYGSIGDNQILTACGVPFSTGTMSIPKITEGVWSAFSNLASAVTTATNSLVGVKTEPEIKFTEKEKEKNREEYKKATQESFDNMPAIREFYADAIKPLENYFDLFMKSKTFDHELIGKIKIMIDEAKNVEKIKKLDFNSLLVVASDLETTRDIISSIRFSLQMDDGLGGLSSHKKVLIYRQLQILEHTLTLTEEKLVTVMSGRLRLLDSKILLDLTSEKADEEYICDERTSWFKPKTLELLDMKETVESKYHRITGLKIIKFLAYIAKNGTDEQKKVFYAAHPDKVKEDEMGAWLDKNLSDRGFPYTSEIKTDMLFLIKQNKKLFITQDDMNKKKLTITQEDFQHIYIIATTLISRANDRDKIAIYRSIIKSLRSEENKFLSSRGDLKSFVLFIKAVNNKAPSSHGLIIARLIEISRNKDDFEEITAAYNLLTGPGAKLLNKLMTLQDNKNQYIIQEVGSLSELVTFIKNLELDQEHLDLVEKALEKFGPVSSDEIVSLLSMGTVNEGLFPIMGAKVIQQCLNESDSCENYIQQVRKLNSLIKKIPLINIMTHTLLLSEITETFGSEESLNSRQTIKNVRKKLGGSCIHYAGKLLVAMQEGKIIDFRNPDEKERIKILSKDAVSLVNAFNKIMVLVSEFPHQSAELKDSFSELMSKIKQFKAINDNNMEVIVILKDVIKDLMSEDNMILLGKEPSDFQKRSQMVLFELLEDIAKGDVLSLGNEDNAIKLFDATIPLINELNEAQKALASKESAPSSTNDLSERAIHYTAQLATKALKTAAKFHNPQQLNLIINELDKLSIPSKFRRTALNFCIRILLFAEGIRSYPPRVKLIQKLYYKVNEIELKASENKRPRADTKSSTDKLKLETPADEDSRPAKKQRLE